MADRTRYCTLGLKVLRGSQCRICHLGLGPGRRAGHGYGGAVDSSTSTAWYRRPAFAALVTVAVLIVTMLLFGVAQRDDAGNRPVPVPGQTSSSGSTETTTGSTGMTTYR